MIAAIQGMRWGQRMPGEEAAVDTPLARADALFEVVRACAERADQERRLPADVAQAMAAQGLYRISLPQACGGEGADPMMQIRTIARISEACASAGWNLMIGIENFGLVAPAMGECAQLLADPLTLLCSSTAAVGEALPDGDGYRISGQWPFASGCHNAQVFAATVTVDGTRCYAVIPEGEWSILDTWHVSGMRGSGSHDVLVQDVHVPARNIVQPIGGVAIDDPLLRFPVGARLAYNKVAVSLGIARAALDTFQALAAGKVPRFNSRKLAQLSHAQRAAAEAMARVVRAEDTLMARTEGLWRKAQAAEAVTSQERAVYQLVCSDAVRSCTESVDLLAEAAGTSANWLDHPLERLARDARVVRQHVTVASQQMEDAGRVLLGQKAQGIMLASP